MMTRARLYAEIGEHARALTQFDMLHKLQPGNAEVPKVRAGKPVLQAVGSVLYIEPQETPRCRWSADGRLMQ